MKSRSIATTYALGSSMSLVGIGLLLPACGTPGAEDSEKVSVSASALVATPGGDEATRVKDFLDRRYAAKDVQHSFVTFFGETIDCVDFFAQPGAKAQAAKGTPLTQIPEPPPSGKLKVDRSKLPDYLLNGKPDKDGKPRACPARTVPILRVTAEQIRAAGGLDSYLQANQRKIPSPVAGVAASPPALGGNGYQYAVKKSGVGPGLITFTGSTTSIFTPKLGSAANAHSISQTWTYSPDYVQTIESGWRVLSSRPQFFTYATRDAYATTGCYNVESATPSTVNGRTCLRFYVSPNAVITPGMELPSGVVGGTQHELTITVSYSGGNWWLGVAIDGEGDEAGYWPATEFTGTMQTSAGGFQVGGEVFEAQKLWQTQMGSGVAPLAGFGQAAYHHDYWYAPASGIANHSFVDTLDFPSEYAKSSAPAPRPGVAWQNYFYFGDAPSVFWGTNYNYSPVNGNDWAANEWKGQCITGYPIKGLSANPSGQHEAHAILCDTSFVGSSGDCQALPFNPGNNLPTPNPEGDWDPGYAKAACPVGEFVGGVAQSTSGSLDKVLCCPNYRYGTQTKRYACGAQTFYSGDSAGYAGFNWDPNYYKGQCPAGQYIAGVSSVVPGGSQAAGAPHAIMCCQDQYCVQATTFVNDPQFGALPQYPLNRTYCPDDTLLAKRCMTTGNQRGSMTSKCSTLPTTCGFLYCIASISCTFSTTTDANGTPIYPLNRTSCPDNWLLETNCTTTRGQAGRMRSKCSTLPTTCGFLYCIASDGG